MTKTISLRDAALAAAKAAEAARVTAGRAVIENALRPASVTALALVHEDADLMIFADPEGTALSVRGNEVALVTGADGEWTSLGAVTSLAELGVLLGAR